MTDLTRRWLIENLWEYFIPAFEENGFQLAPLTGDEADSPELRSAFPFGHLRRVRSRELDLDEIQLDKFSRAAFRLNFGAVPAEGIDHPIGGHIKQEDAWVHDLGRYFEAYSFPTFRRWFAVRRGWFGPSVEEVDYRNLVEDNLGLVCEIEDALREGKQGRHIRVVDVNT